MFKKLLSMMTCFFIMSLIILVSFGAGASTTLSGEYVGSATLFSSSDYHKISVNVNNQLGYGEIVIQSAEGRIEDTFTGAYVWSGNAKKVNIYSDTDSIYYIEGEYTVVDYGVSSDGSGLISDEEGSYSSDGAVFGIVGLISVVVIIVIVIVVILIFVLSQGQKGPSYPSSSYQQPYYQSSYNQPYAPPPAPTQSQPGQYPPIRPSPPPPRSQPPYSQQPPAPQNPTRPLYYQSPQSPNQSRTPYYQQPPPTQAPSSPFYPQSPTPPQKLEPYNSPGYT